MDRISIFVVFLIPVALVDCVCNTALGWHTHNKHCYYFTKGEFESHWTWHEARRFCNTLGAELASIRNRDVQVFVQSLAEQNAYIGPYWIGYNQYQTRNNQWEWTDGDTSQFTDWATNQPSETDLELCAYSMPKQDSSDGLWHSSNCGYRMGFVCRTEENTAPTQPVTVPPTTQTPGYCPQDFFEVGNKCFYLEKGDPDTGKTWQEALEECRRKPGNAPDLASIQSVQENAALTAQLQNSSYGYWVGLTLGSLQQRWVWTDNSDTAYTHWYPGSPNNKGECAELWNNRYPGTWNDHHCSDRRGFICQTYKDGTVNNPPATTPNTCRDDYTPYWYACYKVSRKREGWSGAETDCVSDGGHLASVYSEAENAALLYHASQALNEFPMWLGLQKGIDGEYRWSDGWAVHYTNWQQGYPNDGGDCVAMEADGRWKNYGCTDPWKHACKMTDAPAYTQSSAQPGICPSTEWLEFGGHCYFFGTTPGEGEDSPLQSFEDAQARCQSLAGSGHSGHLVTIHSDAENNFVFGELQKRSDAGQNIWLVWIGLQQDPNNENGYTWVDGSPVSYVKWVPGSRVGRACVQMHVQLWQGLWEDDSCDQSKFFVCESEKAPNTEPPRLPPLAKGSCPRGTEWVEFDDRCLFFSTDSEQPHQDSTDACRSLHSGTELTSIHNEAENWMVREGLRGGVRPTGWIGLYRMPGDDLFTWHWSDGSIVDYTNWQPGEPNNHDGNEFCVEMDSSIGEWNDVPCGNSRMYACKVQKDVTAGLGGGAIFGIIVAVLAAVALIGAASFFFIIPYTRNNNILAKIPFVGSRFDTDSSGNTNTGFENQNYDTQA